ncbi:MAG: hypothetical protein ACHQF2_03365 [Flavobacteriales bacterium]
MIKSLLLVSFLIATTSCAMAQYGPGIGIYPTGTETGLGFRSGKDTRLALDLRITRANMFSQPGTSTFVTECNLIYRAVRLEKVRFHLGIGYKADWNLNSDADKHGVNLPIGVEAFPFAFQNAGLFFEASPFGIYDANDNFHYGIRTVAGFVFYFPKKSAEKPITQ